ncbi:hypothetical protein ACFL3M_02970 [Patescibacteria group bacterium]
MSEEVELGSLVVVNSRNKIGITVEGLGSKFDQMLEMDKYGYHVVYLGETRDPMVNVVLKTDVNSDDAINLCDLEGGIDPLLKQVEKMQPLNAQWRVFQGDLEVVLLFLKCGAENVRLYHKLAIANSRQEKILGLLEKCLPLNCVCA